jgi:hypothetical protein
VFTVVAEQIFGKGASEDVAKLLGQLQVGFDIDAEPLECVRLVAGADAEHQAPFDSASRCDRRLFTPQLLWYSFSRDTAFGGRDGRRGPEDVLGLSRNRNVDPYTR